MFIPKMVFPGPWSNSEIHMKGQSHYNILEESEEVKGLSLSGLHMKLQQLK